MNKNDFESTLSIGLNHFQLNSGYGNKLIHKYISTYGIIFSTVIICNCMALLKDFDVSMWLNANLVLSLLFHCYTYKIYNRKQNTLGKKYVMCTVIHGGVGVVIWGCFSGQKHMQEQF